MRIKLFLSLTLAFGAVANSFAAETDVYYVDPVNNPNIVSIVNTAAPSSTVYVAKGEYKIAATLTPAIGVKIIGDTSNFRDVVIDAQNKCRVILANKGQNYISSITIKGGRVSSNSRTFACGVDLYNGGVITNCRITACIGSYVSGVGLNLHSASAYDTTIDHCTNSPPKATTGAHSTKGFAVCVRYNSVMDRCRVVNNVMIYGRNSNNYYGGALAIANNEDGTFSNSCIVRNCEIAHNVYEEFVQVSTTGFAGLGVSVSAGILENCTIVSNIVKNAVFTDGTEVTVGACGVVIFPSNKGIIRNCHIADNYCNGVLRNYSSISTHGGGNNYLKRLYYCATYPDHDSFPASVIIAEDTKYHFNLRGMVKLEKDSPCINAGEVQNWMTAAKDVYGKPRVCYSKADIGAVEWLPNGSRLVVR